MCHIWEKVETARELIQKNRGNGREKLPGSYLLSNLMPLGENSDEKDVGCYR